VIILHIELYIKRQTSTFSHLTGYHISSGIYSSVLFTALGSTML